MKKSFKLLAFLPALMMTATLTQAQSVPTLELPVLNTPLGNSNYGFGLSTAPVVSEFKNDLLNNSVFLPNTPQATLSVSLRNQQFTGLNYGVANYGGLGYSTLQTTGLVFGANPSLSSAAFPGDNVQGATPTNRYANIGTYAGSGGPTTDMFTSNPNATGADLGTGVKILGSLASQNAGVNVFTTAQALFNNSNYPVGSRVYFGDIVFSFNTPVLNPVISVAGLGGSYRYLPNGVADLPANYRATYFSTELELANTGYTSTKLSGNAYMAVVGNNILNNNDINPNGGSVLDPTEAFNNLGAASGSIRVNGVVKELVYRVYLQSGTASQFAWSTSGVDANGQPLINNAVKNPFTGDIWYVSASYQKPTQQISGNVYNDKDGLTDNNIAQSAGAANPLTNAGGVNANLLNASGLVVATTAVNAEGGYLFDNVPSGNYTVQLTTIAGTGTYAAPTAAPATTLPAGWVTTGEFNGTGVGSDGTPNGRSANVIVATDELKVNINFGIERLPESAPFSNFIPTPALNSVITLNGSLPVLTGNDPEDQPIAGPLTGKSVRITALPNNSQLVYGGVNVSLNQLITNYNPAFLQIKFTVATATGETEFKYAYVDAAGIADPTPATYKILWPNAGPLPIVLQEFTAVGKDCIAELRWITSTEINSSRFDIEVMTENNFVKVGSVAAAGNSTTARNYSFNYNLKSGVGNFFRLKMIKLDGGFTYSEIRTVTCNTPVSTELTVAPNPVISSFTIRGMQQGKNTLVIYSNDGKQVRTEVKSGTIAEVNISNFIAGLYIVRIINENGTTTTHKIIKK